MSSRESRAVARGSAHRRRSKSKDPPNMSDLRIVFLGKSVSENSRVGNFLLGRAAFDSEAPPDVVERVGGTVKDRYVMVINCPQLLQTHISDHHITQTVRECVYLCDPGPHLVVLLLKHDQCSAEDQECVEKVLDSFSERVYQHTMVLTTQEPTETNDILQKIIQKCCNRHFSLQRSCSPDDLLQTFEDIVQMNDGRHLVCAEASLCFTMRQHGKILSERGEKLNLVVCGSDGTLKSSISELILQQTDRRSGVDLHDRVISLVELPALFNTRLSEEEVMRQTLRCVSLCDPGVHVFLLIIPDAPLNNEDKAEIEEIQRIFSSRINKHIMILIMQNSEHPTAELNEETQSVIESFGGRHHFFGPNIQVFTLMENIEKMLEENRGEFFSTETFLEAQMKKLLKYEEMKKKIHSLETPLLSQGSRENTDELRIVLLGKTGVGKSATANTILGRNAFTAETSLESVTKESQRETSDINGRRVTVIDTPGLFDTELTNEEIQREIRHCISMILPGPHVFIIVLNLGQRFTREEATSVKIIQETFGEKSLMFTIVLFTRGDDLKDKTIDQCLGKPGSPLMNLIEACGNRYHVFNNNQTEDRTQVSDLLQKIDDMVKANGESFYSCKMFRQMEREKQEQQMKILMDRVREREELVDKLEEEKERMRKVMDEERQNQDKERKRREEELKREIREQEKHQREIRDEMRRERETFKHEIEEMRQEKEKIKTEKDQLQIEIDRLMNRIANERQNHETERKRREEEFNEREEQYKREKELMKVTDLTDMSKIQRIPINIKDTPVSSLSARRIILLGSGGVGKSAAGNTILGQREFRSEISVMPVTSECSVKHGTVSGRSVSVVDTPELYHRQMRRKELMTEIARSVYLSSPGPHAFLIVFSVRLRGEDKQIIQMIEMIFGEEVLKYSIILFTHGDLLRGEVIEELIQESPALRDVVDQCGGRFHVFNNKDMRRDQVNDLLQKIDTMIEQNGGGHYSNEMYEDAQRFRREEEEQRQRDEERQRNKERQILKERRQSLEERIIRQERKSFWVKVGAITGAVIAAPIVAVAAVVALPVAGAAAAVTGAAAAAAVGAVGGAAGGAGYGALLHKTVGELNANRKENERKQQEKKK